MFTAPHGNLFCGDSQSYEFYYSTAGPISGSNSGTIRYTGVMPAASAAGQKQTITLTGLPTGPNLWVDVQATSGATRNGGNLGAVSNAVGWGAPGGESGRGGVLSGGLGGRPDTLPNPSRGLGMVGVLSLLPALLALLLARRLPRWLRPDG